MGDIMPLNVMYRSHNICVKAQYVYIPSPTDGFGRVKLPNASRVQVIVRSYQECHVPKAAVMTSVSEDG